jgi:hypothetical protein
MYSPELVYGDPLVVRWEINTEKDLAGYNAYFGSSFTGYDLVVNLGNVTECDLGKLSLYEDVPYVMALTAYDFFGNESDFSTPLYFTLDDGIVDSGDNCEDIYNPNQEDNFPPQGNGIGDACDCEGDFDCDGDCDGTDAAKFKQYFGRSQFTIPCANGNQCYGNFDCDHDCDGTDAALFKLDFGRNRFNNPCPLCITWGWCVEDSCTNSEHTEYTCDDDKDNDCDGAVDCDDTDCLISCGNDRCDPCENCISCPEDCEGKQYGKPDKQFCCGDGIQQIAEGDGIICEGNY